MSGPPRAATAEVRRCPVGSVPVAAAELAPPVDRLRRTVPADGAPSREASWGMGRKRRKEAASGASDTGSVPPGWIHAGCFAAAASASAAQGCVAARARGAVSVAPLSSAVASSPVFTTGGLGKCGQLRYTQGRQGPETHNAARRISRRAGTCGRIYGGPLGSGRDHPGGSWRTTRPS